MPNDPSARCHGKIVVDGVVECECAHGADGICGFQAEANQMADPDPSAEREQAIRELAGQLDDAARQLRTASDDWAKIVTIPTLQEGQRHLIALLSTAARECRESGDTLARQREALETLTTENLRLAAERVCMTSIGRCDPRRREEGGGDERF
jgi:alkylhydroperoxidase/carboxymuconolactone decarboxylase family protein YurZ